MNTNWSEKEKSYIKSNAHRMTPGQMVDSEELKDRTVGGVAAQMKRMGLKGKRGPKGKADLQLAEMTRVLSDAGYGPVAIKRLANVVNDISLSSVKKICQYETWRG